MVALRSGKIPTTSVRRRISRLRRSLGLLDPDLAPDLFGEGGEGEDVGAGGVEVVEHRGQRGDELAVEELVELGVDRDRVGLVVDAVQHRFHAGPGGLRAHSHEVGGVVGAADSHCQPLWF